MEEQSSAFLPGSGSGFPKAWALRRSQRSENRASLSASIGLRELWVCRSCAAATAEEESRSWQPGCFLQAARVQLRARAGAGSRARSWRSGALGSLLRAAVGSLLLVQAGVSAVCGAGRK